MKQFELLDTITADAGFIAYGKTEAMLFENASFALFSLMCDIGNVKAQDKKEFRLKRKNVQDLLFDYLNELIFVKDRDAVLLSKFTINVQKNTTYNLFAQVYGERIDTKRHTLKVDVKAVTKHLFKVEKVKGGYKATVIVDI